MKSTNNTEHAIQRAITLSLEETIQGIEKKLSQNTLTSTPIKAKLVLKRPARIAGLPFLPFLLEPYKSYLNLELLVDEGKECPEETEFSLIEGPIDLILELEELLISFIQHTSAIATFTSLYVKEIAGYSCDILNTSYTLPCLKAIQEYAVRVGGGKNKRFHLNEEFLIKGRHLSKSSLEERIDLMRKEHPEVKVTVQVDSLSLVDIALAKEANAIILDNMDLSATREAVRRAKGKAYLEASSEMTLSKVRAYAAAGLDGISIPALTLSPPPIEICLKV